METPQNSFEVFVTNESFKFNAAHFVAYPNFRERLHGHNYHISIRLFGSHFIGRDGYVIDFGDVKDAARTVCKRLNEHFLCPMYSDVMTITRQDKSIRLLCEDGAEFMFPCDDVAMLPIVHATTEELAVYCWGEIVSQLNTSFLLKRGIHTMAVICGETPSQEAVFRMTIPVTEDPEEIKRICDARIYVNKGEVILKPCLEEPSPKFQKSVEALDSNSKDCCSTCKDDFSRKLQVLADSINSGTFEKVDKDKPWTVSDLEQQCNYHSK